MQQLASRNYALLKVDPAHPSLQFKLVKDGKYRSVRVGLHYRALGVPVAKVSNGFGSVHTPSTIRSWGDPPAVKAAGRQVLSDER